MGSGIGNEEAVKRLTGGILTTEYSKFKFHRLLMDVETYFFQYGLVGDLISIFSKASRSTANYELHVTVTGKNRSVIPDKLLCLGTQIFVIVEGREPHCWTCGVLEHLSSVCSGSKWALQSKSTSSEKAVG